MKIKQITEFDNQSNLSQIGQNKKAKIIGMVPGTAPGQPATYKISTDPNADPAQAMTPNAPNVMNVSANNITKDAAGNITINTNPNSPTNSPDTSLVGKDAQVKEEPNEDQVFTDTPNNKNTFPVDLSASPPVVLTGGTGPKPVLKAASAEITQDLVNKSVPPNGDYQLVFIKISGKTYPCLMTHREARVSPGVFAAIYKGPNTSNIQPIPNAKPGEKGTFMPIPNAKPGEKGTFKALEESTELDAMLRIAGLR